MSRFKNQRSSSHHSELRPLNVTTDQKKVFSENACSHCGRDRYKNPCGPCKIKDLEDFRKIREYVSQFPHSNPIEVASATNVKVSVITRLMRNGLINSTYEMEEVSEKNNHVYRNHFSWE